MNVRFALSMAMPLALFAASNAFAEAECLSAYGKTACGYDCIEAYGNIKCAQTPMGTCAEAYGNIVCYDPPGNPHKKAECKESYGNIVCGYHCIAAYGNIKCAQTPEGICTESYGEITCYDPPEDTDSYRRPHRGHRPRPSVPAQPQEHQTYNPPVYNPPVYNPRPVVHTQPLDMGENADNPPVFNMPTGSLIEPRVHHGTSTQSVSVTQSVSDSASTTVEYHPDANTTVTQTTQSSASISVTTTYTNSD